MENTYIYMFLNYQLNVIIVPMLLQLKCISAFIINLFDSMCNIVTSVSR
jgi:hypothetical protein